MLLYLFLSGLCSAWLFSSQIRGVYLLFCLLGLLLLFFIAWTAITINIAINKDLAEKNKIRIKVKIKDTFTQNNIIAFTENALTEKYFSWDYAYKVEQEKWSSIQTGDEIDIEVAIHSEIILNSPLGKEAIFQSKDSDEYYPAKQET